MRRGFFRLVCLLSLTLLGSCLTPRLWRGTLLVDPVTEKVGETPYRLDSILAGLHLGEPVVLLQCHASDGERRGRRFLLRSNEPATAKASPLFILLKPSVTETFSPSAIGLQLTSFRFVGSSADPEILARIGIRGKVGPGPDIRRIATKDLPAGVRHHEPLRITDGFDPQVQTLLDRFGQSFRLPGRSRAESRSLWTPVAWVGGDGRILEDAEVAKAMSGIPPLTDQRCGVRLFAQGLGEDQRSLAWIAVSLEAMVLQRDLQDARLEDADGWTLFEEFRVTPVPGDFALDRGSTRALPNPDLEIELLRYEMRKGVVSDSLVTKVLLTPITVTLDVVGYAIAILWEADGDQHESPPDMPLYKKTHIRWKQVRQGRKPR